MAGDGTGLHVLVAERKLGYAWRTAASLWEPGFDTDQWIGNACLTESGHRLVVAYAPRGFTNRPELADRGAFSAVVDLMSGAVDKLPVRVSLAYFNPGCGAGEQAVLTQAGDTDLGATRLIELDATTGRVDKPIELAGQITSAVPTSGGIVAVDWSRLVQVGRDGSLSRLAGTEGPAFNVKVDALGGVMFMDRSGDTARIRRLPMPTPGTPATLATGPLTDLTLQSGAEGRVFIVGRPATLSPLPTSVSTVDAPVEAAISSHGLSSLTHVPRSDNKAEPGRPKAVMVDFRLLTGQQPIEFTLEPAAVVGRHFAAGRQPSPAGAVADRGSDAPTDSPTDPIDADRSCSVPRNDPRAQVYQPTPRQVEWAANQAVTGSLTVRRPANWKGSGLPEYTPQGMFPLSPPLAGGGRIPAQILLGILAQESNLWQASYHALPGVTGNPLVSNFYGRAVYDEDPDNDWDIAWQEADCGYGVAQITDGMRRTGHQRPGEVLLPATQQRAVALDYAANIARSVQMLHTKWNKLYAHDMLIHGGDPDRIENWFFAAWSYNSGFYPYQGPGVGEPWGVGWFNNPINPRYPPHRRPFLEDTYDDARTPQLWPYPEKVVGWAGHPIATTSGAGFRAAWWLTDADRANAKPPIDLFCAASNSCDPTNETAPCGRADYRCWFHNSVSWQGDCPARCGHELLRFDPGYPEQPDGDNYPPRCSLGGLPSTALVIDDVPDSVPSVRPNCPRTWTNAGDFTLAFNSDGSHYPSKVDFHQIGGGFGGHFWFGHTRKDVAPDRKLKTTGTWTLDRDLHQWARVMVHIPDHGAHTQQARYQVELGNGTTRTRVILQRTLEHRWVPLGAFRFDGTPRVHLSTTTYDGDGTEDVAWDAIAFQPLPAKPRHMIVALGDSYTSGEGASADGGVDYYAETDNNGGNRYQNACHRSRHAWSRRADLLDRPASTIGYRADTWDANVDYHLLACSGAQTENLLPKRTIPAGQVPPHNAFGETGAEQHRELTQLDRGFLDEDTTLVTLSIGGNDARFSTILETCITLLGVPCEEWVIAGDSRPLSETQPPLMAGPVKESILITLREIHARAPKAKSRTDGITPSSLKRPAPACPEYPPRTGSG